jgi:mannose-6-phosphate isomerase-like protein (cupin superfamily)
MTFWNLNTLKLEEFRPGIVSKAEIGKELIMVCMEIDADKEDSGHMHDFDQCGIVIDGVIEMFIGEERMRLKSNQSYFIPSGVKHGWKTFSEAAKILDVSLK